MNAFTIKDLENLSGIKAHTIRIWEQRYSFLQPQRSNTNIRYYCNDELKTVLNIALLNKYGYKISHIDKMSPAQIREKILSLSQAEANIERLVNDLIHCMVDLDSDGFEDVLDHYIRVKGNDKTITSIIFPFLDKVGLLWMTNNINIAQEHLATNIIRQKLLVGIESAGSQVQLNKTVLLFLPEGEQHEVGLLYVYYLLKTRGMNVIYLGADLPVKDLEYVVSIKKPDCLYTHVTCMPSRYNFGKLISQVSQHIPNVKLVISGQAAISHNVKLPDWVIVKNSISDVIEALI